MEPIAFCSRCRGMRVGWNRKYILHSLICQEIILRSVKLLIFGVILSSFIFAFPIQTGIVFSDLAPVQQGNDGSFVEASIIPDAGVMASVEPAVREIDRFLAQHGVTGDRGRVARAIVQNSRKYNVDPKLVASIIIVESRANPFAISDSDSVGIMQIHLPTWGPVADKENINLFRVEDNVLLGIRILKGYISSNGGVWEGVMRYKGWTDTPESQAKVDEYVQKVKRIYQPETASLVPDLPSPTQ